MANRFNALYFSPRQVATGCPCHVDVLPTQLAIELSESEVETVTLQKFAVKSGGFDQDHLVLTWTHEGEERQLYIKDPTVIEALKNIESSEVGRQVHQSALEATRIRQRRWTWVWISMTSLIVLLAGLWFGSDVLVRTTVDRIPIEWERQLGDVTRQELLAAQRVMKEGPAADAVEEITHRLTEQFAKSPYRFDVTLVRNDTVNAMALPGGSIIVYTGLVKESESPEEVAGVLAHEVSHVVLRHGLENMVQSVGVIAVITVLMGNQQGLLGLFERLGVQMATMKFSRAKESEADLEGLRLLHKANISPHGMIGFFERLAKTEGTPTALLSTHPMSAERAARLKSEVSSLPTMSPISFPFDWASIKNSF